MYNLSPTSGSCWAALENVSCYLGKIIYLFYFSIIRSGAFMFIVNVNWALCAWWGSSNFS